MSLTQHKEKAKTALETLRQVEKLLDMEARQRYRQALETVARYNGELRRDRSTMVALADAATRPGETSRETERSREIKRLQSEINQLREQTNRDRNRPIMWSEDLIYDGLNKFVNDNDFTTLCKSAQFAALKSVIAVCLAAKNEAPSPPLESAKRWARLMVETIIEIHSEYDPELADVITLEDDPTIMPYPFSERPIR